MERKPYPGPPPGKKVLYQESTNYADKWTEEWAHLDRPMLGPDIAIYYEESAEITDEALEELEQWALAKGLLVQKENQTRVLTARGWYTFIKDALSEDSEHWPIPDTPHPRNLWLIAVFAFAVIFYIAYLFTL